MSVVVRKRTPTQDAFCWTGTSECELQLLGCLVEMAIEASVNLKSRELTLRRVGDIATVFRVGDWIVFDADSGWPTYCAKEKFDTNYEVVKK